MRLEWPLLYISCDRAGDYLWLAPLLLLADDDAGAGALGALIGALIGAGLLMRPPIAEEFE
jgi:hypothetical protein